jgi:putative flippase GtrA
MKKIPVIIPSFMPDSRLLDLINDLVSEGIEHIITVRDGCTSDYNHIYDVIKNNPKCILVEHDINKGKGRAIKTGIKTYQENKSFTHGFVLADADGQHLPQDILKVIKKLKENPDALVIGARSFDKEVPFRSKFGNLFSRYIFSFLLGRKISDTQSGLRGMPHKYLENFYNLEGEKYEFETNVLVETRKSDIEILEVPIATVYLEKNSSSHFNPIIDSIKIYWVLVKYSMSSMASFALDYGLFLLLHFVTGNLAISSYCSRAISLSFNYQANKNIVFRYENKSKLLFLRYLLLCLFSITVSYLAVSYLKTMRVNLLFSKLIVESILFFFNFYIQKKWIFKNLSHTESVDKI